MVMEYVKLGNSGLKVSKIILGCMSYGHKDWAGGWVLGEEESLPLLKAAWDAGINTWDTANIYSNGESEVVIAKAIEKYNIPRHQLVIATKCHFPVAPTPGYTRPDDKSDEVLFVNQNGLSRAAIFNAVEASLKRLNTTYIDLFQIHRCDKDVSKEETMRALHDLVQSGQVRYIGASSMWAWEFAQYQHIAELKGWTKFITMQNQYNLIYKEEEREMNPFCNETGVGLIPWSPIAGGQLSRPVKDQDATKRAEVWKGHPMFTEHTEIDNEIITRTEKVAKDKGWTMSQVAFVWVASKVAAPIVGISKLERFQEYLDCLGKSLTEEETKFLEEPYRPTAVRGHS